MKRLMACLVLLMGLVCLSPVRDAEAANWVWVTSTDYAKISIDSSTARKYNGFVYFWDRWDYIDSAERTEMIEELNENGQNIDYSDLYTVKTHYCEYRARNGTVYSEILGIIYYDSRGKVISSSTTPDYALYWQSYPPDSIGEAVFCVAQAYAW